MNADDTRPLLLDLYSGAGGASVGYARAGFRVIGVDHADQADYPFPFERADALDWIRDVIAYGPGPVAAIHASPPCQAVAAITLGTNQYRRHLHRDLYPSTRALLERTGLPYVIENPSARPDVVLCGEMFGLGVIRHRRFEFGNWPDGLVLAPPHVPHRGRVRGWRHGRYFDGPYVSVYGDGGGKGSVDEWRRAMGIDWTRNRRALAEAVPPAYAEWVGAQLIRQLEGVRV